MADQSILLSAVLPASPMPLFLCRHLIKRSANLRQNSTTANVNIVCKSLSTFCNSGGKKGVGLTSQVTTPSRSGSGVEEVVVITSVYGCKMRCLLLSSGPAPASFIAPQDVTALQT